jgi:hypothetical protein
MPTIKERDLEYERILGIKQKYEHELHKWLAGEGWEHTCQTPGSTWMWKRKLADGTFVYGNVQTATHFALHMLGDEMARERSAG